MWHAHSNLYPSVQAIDGEIQPSLFEEAHVDSPNVFMKVTERGGADITSAKVGDPLELRFEIFDQESPYEIFVRDLVIWMSKRERQIPSFLFIYFQISFNWVMG